MRHGRLEIKVIYHPPEEDPGRMPDGLGVSFSRECLEDAMPGFLMSRIKFLLLELSRKCPDLNVGLINQFRVKE